MEILIWVMLVFRPENILPEYLSVWQDKTTCEQRAKELNRYMGWNGTKSGEPYIACVREALRDTAKE